LQGARIAVEEYAEVIGRILADNLAATEHTPSPPQRAWQRKMETTAGYTPAGSKKRMV
jgi:hypothetical protein